MKSSVSASLVSTCPVRIDTDVTLEILRQAVVASSGSEGSYRRRVPWFALLAPARHDVAVAPGTGHFAGRQLMI